MSANEVTDSQEDAPSVGILVICKNPDGMRGPIGFLNRRGVQAIAVGTMNDAIDKLSKKLANYVLLSVNFSHPKVDLLPGLFHQTFNVDCIAFSETSDRKSESRLANFKCRHIIYGQASGPAILMKLRQIQRELEQATSGTEDTEASNNEREVGKRDDGGEVIVAGRNSGRAPNSVVLKGGGKKGGSSADAAEYMLKTLSGPSESPEPIANDNESEGDSGHSYRPVLGGGSEIGRQSFSSTKAKKSSGGTYLSKGRAPKKFAMLQKGQEVKPRGFGVALTDPRTTSSPFARLEPLNQRGLSGVSGLGSAGRLSSTLSVGTDVGDLSARASEAEVNPLDAIQGSTEQRDIDAESHDARKWTSADTREQAARRQAPQSENQRRNGSETERKTSGPTSSEVAEAIIHDGNLKKTTSPAAIHRDRGNYFSATEGAPGDVAKAPAMSLFWECARKALLDISSADGVYDGGMESIHSMGFLNIRTKDIKGSFLMAVGIGRDYPFGAISQLHQRLLHHLRDQGKTVEDADCTVMEIDTGVFPVELFASGDFNLTAKSDHIEIGIAYLNMEHVEPEIARSGSEPGHAVIRVQDIFADTPVTFDAYLSLPVNRKRVRYLKVGARLSDHRKERLVAGGADRLLINDTEVKAFREFYARNTIHTEMEKRKDEHLKKKKAG